MGDGGSIQCSVVSVQRPVDREGIGANGTGKEYDIGVYAFPPARGTVILMK
jgi:hypothetical protein